MQNKQKLNFLLLLTLLITLISSAWADNPGWNSSRRYMTHGICNSQQERACWGGGRCDNGGNITQCSDCSDIGGGWYQYNYYCSACTTSSPYPKCDPNQTGFKVGLIQNCSVICAAYVAAGNICSNIDGQYCTNINCDLACECGVCTSAPQAKTGKTSQN